MSSTFRVLHVCTGNICRSPVAEHLMRDGLRRRLGEQAERFIIESAGTWGFEGAGMEPDALDVLGGYRVDGAAFRARELLAEHAQDADLVLTAAREHRAAAVVLHPRGASRTFTLLEFARLTSLIDPAGLPAGDPVERAFAVVRAAAGNRGRLPPLAPGEDDVDDPYRGPRTGFEEMARVVGAALRGPLDLIGGAAADEP